MGQNSPFFIEGVLYFTHEYPQAKISCALTWTWVGVKRGGREKYKHVQQWYKS